MDKKQNQLKGLLKELLFWTKELRQNTKEAAEFWDDYVGPGVKDHPADRLFQKFKSDNLEIDYVIKKVENKLKEDDFKVETVTGFYKKLMDGMRGQPSDIAEAVDDKIWDLFSDEETPDDKTD